MRYVPSVSSEGILSWTTTNLNIAPPQSVSVLGPQGTQSFQGEPASGYATCSTAASTVAKVGTCSAFTLSAGKFVIVKFTYANTSAYPTLNINGTGAIEMYCGATRLTGSNYWAAGEMCMFIYDGSYYRIIGGTLLNAQGQIGGSVR